MSSVSKKAAFTLIELLVVISIILIATSILYVGGGGGGEGVNLSSSQRIVSSIAQGARGQALLKGAKTRLIIYSDANTTNADPEKLLRYFGIIYAVQGVNDDGEPVTLWKAATQGTYITEGIYFDPDLSADNFWPRATMSLEYPRQSAQAEGSGAQYYFYEFNPNGTVSNNPDFVNSWLVLSAGTLKPNEAGNLAVDFSDEDKEGLKAALIFRRVGTTTAVTDPSEIISGN